MTENRLNYYALFQMLKIVKRKAKLRTSQYRQYCNGKIGKDTFGKFASRWKEEMQSLLTGTPITIVTQNNPRGYTARIYIEGQDVSDFFGA